MQELSQETTGSICPVQITEYPSLTNSHQWESGSTTWDKFCQGLIQRGHPELEDKKAGKLWAPYALAPGERRGNDQVRELTLCVLDLDNATEAEALEVFDGLQGLEWLAYSTHSYDPTTDQGQRWRIVLPLPAPVPAARWRAFWAGVVRRYIPGADTQCKDLSRCYWYPYRRPGAPAEFLQGHGSILDPGDFTNLVVLPPPKAVGNRLLNVDVLRALSGRWKRSKDLDTVDMGSRLSRVVLGESFAAPGERDGVAFKLVNRIVKEYPDTDPQGLADAMGQSLHRMALEHPDGALTKDQIADKVIRAREFSHRIAENKAGQSTDRSIKAISQAFGEERAHGYTAEELAKMADDLGIEPYQLDRAWVLQHLRAYYVLGHGTKYEIATRESLQNTARVVLAPSPVPLYVNVEGQDTLISPQALLENWSTPITEVSKSLVAQTPRLDLKARTLTLPACVRRELEPCEDPKVAEWLEILGGKRHENLLNWLAFVTDLGRPVSALVMVGNAGAGKSLLAKGLSRIWTTQGPTKLAHAMGHFDAAIEHCPLVFGDEQLPKDFRGRVRTEDLREFIQQTSRRVDAKFVQPYTLQGAVRVVIAGNDASLLETKEHLTNHAVAAIAERFFFVHVTKAVETHLLGIGGRDFIDPNWIERDALARHVLWIVQNRKPAWAGRFGVAHDSSGVATRLSVRNGLRSLLCEWLVKYTLRHAAINVSPESQDRIVLASDGIGIHVQAILDNWSTIFRDEKIPQTTAASVALSELASSRVELNGEWLSVVPLETLCAWAEETGFCTGAKLREAVDK